MEYKMEELLPIVAELAGKYAGCDSTSITYEKAQMLMAGVIYCLNENRHKGGNEITDAGISLKERYLYGRRIVFEKAEKVRTIYNEMIESFDDYNVECLGDTVKKGIPEFLKWYDAKYSPQETILTLDYPLLTDVHRLRGVDAVYSFICGIREEQLFLKKFERNYITEILNKALPDYRHMIENVSEIVLLNLLGHIAIGKSLHENGFTKEEYEALEQIFLIASVPETEKISEIEKIINTVLEKMIAQVYEGNQKLLAYFKGDLRNMAARIDMAVKLGHLDKVFVF